MTRYQHQLVRTRRLAQQLRRVVEGLGAGHEVAARLDAIEAELLRLTDYAQRQVVNRMVAVYLLEHPVPLEERDARLALHDYGIHLGTVFGPAPAAPPLKERPLCATHS